jgi:hypothetical protein
MKKPLCGNRASSRMSSRCRTHNILVDSCIGNDENFPLRPAWNKKNDGNWMSALKAAGLGGRKHRSRLSDLSGIQFIRIVVGLNLERIDAKVGANVGCPAAQRLYLGSCRGLATGSGMAERKTLSGS